jgi:hypothetical protein
MVTTVVSGSNAPVHATDTLVRRAFDFDQEGRGKEVASRANSQTGRELEVTPPLT